MLSRCGSTRILRGTKEVMCETADFWCESEVPPSETATFLRERVTNIRTRTVKTG
jgi:hypothetical protein